MVAFNYEWWTIDITQDVGRLTWEFKGKDKAHVIKQIKAEERKNAKPAPEGTPVWKRPQPFLKIHWETLKLDHKGYQRNG